MGKISMLPVLGFCVLPLAAQSQSVSLLYTRFTPRDTHIPVMGSLRVSTDKTSSFGLRYSHDITTLPKLGDARLSAEGTWVRETGAEDIAIENISLPPGAKMKYSQEYLGLGLAMQWTKVVDFGTALEVRRESNYYEMSGLAPFSINSSERYTRPWISFRTGYTFQSSRVKPFVALEYSLPLAKKTKSLRDDEGVLYDGSLARNLNPKSQLTFNAGLKF